MRLTVSGASPSRSIPDARLFFWLPGTNQALAKNGFTGSF